MDADLCIKISLLRGGVGGVSYIVSNTVKTLGAHRRCSKAPPLNRQQLINEST